MIRYRQQALTTFDIYGDQKGNQEKLWTHRQHEGAPQMCVRA